MVIQFTLQDLMIFLVCALAIAAGILLIPILWNIKKVVGIIRPLVESNQAAYKISIAAIPGIVENVGQISSDVKESSARLKTSLPVILQDVQSAASTAKEGIKSAGVVVNTIGSGINDTFAFNSEDSAKATGFMAYLPVIKEVLQLILRAFLPGK